jgi:hypothetical protein
MANGAVVENHGEWDLDDDSGILQTAMPDGSYQCEFTDWGILDKAGGDGTSTINVHVTIYGEVLRDHGVLRLTKGYAVINGTLNAHGGPIRANAPAEQDSRLTELLGGSLSITGSLVQNGGTFSGNTGQLSMTGTYQENGGTFAFAGGRVAAAGTLVANGAVFSGYGSITSDVTNSGEVDVLAPDGYDATLSLTGNFTQLDGATNIRSYGGNYSFAVSANFTINGGTLTMADAALTVGGNFQQTGGTTYLNGSNVYISGTLTQSGGLIIDPWESWITVTGSATLSGGELRLEGGQLSAASVSILSGGYLVGDGTVVGSVTNAGLIVVDDAGGYPHTLSINGNYTQTQTDTLRLYTEVGAGGVLAVSGSATLGGTLDINGLMSDALLMTYGSRSGEFSSVIFPPHGPDWNWILAYDYPSPGKLSLINDG